MQFLFVIVFLVFSVTKGCDTNLSCNECKLELCYYLKFYNNTYVCSEIPKLPESKYQVEDCKVIQKTHNNSQGFFTPNNENSLNVFGDQRITNNSFSQDFGHKLNSTTFSPLVDGLTLKGEVRVPDTEGSQSKNNTNSPSILIRYNSRLQRNFCHQARLLQFMKKRAGPGFTNSLEKMISANSFANKGEICAELIRARRQERLINCTACGISNIGGQLSLVSDGCSLFTTCVECVSYSTCNYVMENGQKYCANLSVPIPPGGTVIPPNEELWCPKPPPAPESASTTYERLFWVLFCLLLIGMSSCIIGYIKKRRGLSNRSNSPELYLLNNLEAETATV